MIFLSHISHVIRTSIIDIFSSLFLRSSSSIFLFFLRSLLFSSSTRHCQKSQNQLLQMLLKPTPLKLSTKSCSHSVQICNICLNGNNFLSWSQSVRMYIRGRGKIGYLTSDCMTKLLIWNLLNGRTIGQMI